MLKVLRHKNVAKITFWALLILILPAFVLWGTGEIGGSGKKGPKYVGIIDGKNISFKEFSESLYAIRCQIILNYFSVPEVMDKLLKRQAFLGKLAWDRLILYREALKLKVKVSDPEVISFIKTHPIFNRGGEFDDRLYNYILRNNIGISPRNFEEMMRDNLIIKKFNESVTRDVTITDEEVIEAYRKENEKFRILYTIISSDDFIDKVNIPDDDIRKYYDTHKDEFLIPGKNGMEDEKGIAAFDGVRESIKSYLAERDAKNMALKYAIDEHKKIKDAMEKEKISFEDALKKFEMKSLEAGPFSRSDYIDGIGESYGLVEKAVKMRSGEISEAVETRKGAVIFKVLENQPADRDKFEKDKTSFTAKALEEKKNLYLENWLRGLENNTTLNIDLADYEKYYR